MTEEQFHRSRRMFVLPPNGVLQIAKLGDTRSHAEWFADTGGRWHDAMEKWPRGYFNGNRLFIYQGADFRGVDTATVRTICSRLKDRLLPETEVFSGTVKQDFIGQWVPRQRLGRLEELVSV